MGDPISATIQVVQLGISAVRATTAIANAWNTRQRNKGAQTSRGIGGTGAAPVAAPVAAAAAAATGASTAEAAENPGLKGATIDEVLLVLATLGQRLLLLDVVDYDVLPQASEAVRSAMCAVDAKCDDIGESFDELEPILQNLVACAYVFCAACHPIPIWHGFGCAIMDRTDWATPEKPNWWTNDVEKGIAFLKSVPQPWKLLKKSPSAISKEEPDFAKTERTARRQMDGVLEDMVKQFEKSGMPQPLPPNHKINIRTWGFAFATYGGNSFYMDVGHNTKLVSRYQADAGRFLYAWTIGERADLRSGDAILLHGSHIGALAEWLEGLNGMSHKVLKDSELDWSNIKYKASTRKIYRAHCGHEQGINDEPFVMVRNPDPSAHISKRLDELHFVPVTAASNTTSSTSVPVSPTLYDDRKDPIVSINTVSPLQSPTRDLESNPISPIIVPVVARRKSTLPTSLQDSQASGISTAASRSSAGSTVPASPIATETTISPISSTTSASPFFPSTPAAVEAQQPLPPGWEERCLPDGKPYYIDHTTCTTSWERPVMAEAAPVPSYEAVATAEQEKPLPPGWESRVDPQWGVYFIDHNTRTSSWERPV